jgi:hypothetical protein
VAANAAKFTAKYPTVTNFVAGWTGMLSNSSNRIVLEDALGTKVDEVQYADDGDWSIRERDDPDFGHRGWRWRSPADGFGKSLELINVLFDNSLGQNWMASTATNGTPGAQNSVAANDIAPVILDGGHFPLVPKSTDSVAVTCRVIDDHATSMTVSLHWRPDGGTWTTVPMFDDGAHGDAAVGGRSLWRDHCAARQRNDHRILFPSFGRWGKIADLARTGSQYWGRGAVAERAF